MDQHVIADFGLLPCVLFCESSREPLLRSQQDLLK
jgi:hypothetical protein